MTTKHDLEAFYQKMTRQITRTPYRDLRRWRNRLERDVVDRWVYRHTTTTRTPEGDRFILAWINAEIVRRIWANPLVQSRMVDWPDQL